MEPGREDRRQDDVVFLACLDNRVALFERDLKRFFDLPDGGLTGLPKIIVLESKSMTFGILADTVNGTRSVPLDSIQPALPTLNDVRGKYLKGVTNDRMAILDGKSILCDETIVVNQQEK